MSNSRPSRHNPGASVVGSRHSTGYHFYRIFDIPIRSEIRLPELPVCSKPEARITIRWAGAVQVAPSVFATCHEWQENGLIICSIARRGTDYLMVFPGVNFLIAQGGTITCAPAPGVSDNLVRHVLLNQVLPRYLAHMGELVVHASAVTLPDGRTVAFLGESGYGKSTLALYCRGQGAHLIDDDCVLLRSEQELTTVIGGVPTVRLHPDSQRALGTDPAAFAPITDHTNKQQMRLADVPPVDAGTPWLDTLFLLGAPRDVPPDGSVTIVRATGQSSVMAAVRSTFNLDPSNHETMTRTFGHISHLLGGGLPVYHLRYPREHSLLPRIFQALLNHRDY